MDETWDMLQQQVDRCVEAHGRGELSQSSLQQVAQMVAAVRPKRQSLLYMQTHSTELSSEVLGMSMVIDGQVAEPGDDPDKWPYQSVLDAINDGWRGIVFPDLALMMQDGLPQGLDCEFILEKYS